MIAYRDSSLEHLGKCVLTDSSLQVTAMPESDIAFSPRLVSYLPIPFHACLPSYHPQVLA